MSGLSITALVEATGWTLLHFVWQAAVIAGGLACILRSAPRWSPANRYVVSGGALAAMAAATMVTFPCSYAPAIARHRTASIAGERVPSPPPAGAPVVAPAAVPEDSSDNMMSPIGVGAAAARQADSLAAGPAARAAAPVWESSVRPWLPTVVGTWALGVFLLSVRLLMSWRHVELLRGRGVAPLGGEWPARFQTLKDRLGVSRPVALLVSSAATVPMVIGYLRPAILVPASTLGGLSVAELEAILAHELLHVRRHDYLVNLVQNVMETLFFFHPAVWWVSTQMRREREHCCDDGATAAAGSVLEYARALAALEQIRQSPALGVPAGGGSLVARIRRLTAPPAAPGGRGWPVAMLVVALLFAFAVAVPMHRDAVARPTPDRRAATPADGDPGAITPAGEGAAGQRVLEPAEPREVTAAGATGAAQEPNGIAISVLDATGEKPIPEFRVLAGVRSSVSDDFEKRTGYEAVNWQPHTARVGTGGALVWPLQRAYREMALRVEADGYQPQVHAWIKKADGPARLVFRMVEDPGVNGRVLSPDGRPARGARVALGLPQKNIVIRDGQIHGAADPPPEKPGDAWRRPTVAVADADGRFRLPSETEPTSAIVVVHASGVLAMSGVDFQRNPDMRLQPWGRIEGQVLWQDRAGAGETVTLSIHRDQYGYPGTVASYAETVTDAEGRFTFNHVLPGLVQISRPFKFDEPTKSGITSVNLDGLVTHSDAKAGDPTPVVVGGQGRTVAGKLVGRTRWDDVTFHFHPTAPHFGFPGDDDMWKAFAKFRESELGPIFFRNGIKPNADGTFEIPRVLPGTYQLFVSAPGNREYAASTAFRVLAEAPGEDPAAMDLGQIPVKPPDQPPQP